MGSFTPSPAPWTEAGSHSGFGPYLPSVLGWEPLHRPLMSLGLGFHRTCGDRNSPSQALSGPQGCCHSQRASLSRRDKGA